MSADDYGFILTQTLRSGWIKSGQAVPMELYTPEVQTAHLERVRELYGPVIMHLLVTAADLALVDKQDAESMQSVDWVMLGDLIPFGLDSSAQVIAFLRRRGVETGELDYEHKSQAVAF